MKVLLKGLLILLAVWGVALTAFFLYVWFGTALFDNLMMERIRPYICTVLFEQRNANTEIEDDKYLIFQEVGKKVLGKNGVCPTYEGVLWKSGIESFEEIKKSINSINNSILKYSNTQGYFSIILPSQLKAEERYEGGDSATIVFTNEGKEVMQIFYAKPFIEGKGGACIDNEGNGAYKTEMIAGQEVDVCEIEGFDAAYFKNPNRDIEYTVYINKPEEISLELYESLKTAVMETLSFH